PVRVERLLEDLWPDVPHGAAPNTLQSKVSRLRRALADPALLHGDNAGYALLVDPHHVDAVRVLRLTEQAGALRAAADPRAVDVCEQALALFRGDVLPAAADASWARPYVTRLEAARLGLNEHRLAAMADLGAAGELVADLEDLVAAHPLREPLWALLVTALYRAGRQGDALAAVARARHQLATQLGVDPGPQLRALELQVLQQDPVLTLRLPRETVTATGSAVGNLPRTTGSLLGRDHHLDRLSILLGQHRLVTLTGPAGVGKTRLAVEAAHRFGIRGGAWLARVETATDAATVWQSIGTALAVDAATRGAVSERLRGAELLLVLDSCEHVVDVVGDVITALLGSSPGVRVLATSQLPLRVPGESVLDLETLTLTDAVTLFTDRASAQRPYPTDDEHTRGTVEKVCRSLDGLPLAIELAAARTRVLPVHEIARRLDDRFALLLDPTSSLPPRHSALRAALAWSYDLLFPDDQRGLWALASFSGGGTLAAVEAVLGALEVPPAAGLDVISRLVDRSLAIADIGSRGPARYRLLDSVRALGREQLGEAGHTDLAAAAHAEWFAQAADRAALGARGPDQGEHLDLARAERANIDTALSWCAGHDPALGVRIALGFGWTWVVLGTGVEGAHRVRAALAAAAPSDRERAAALTLCGWFEASGGDLDRAAADLEEALRIGDARAGAVAGLYLAFVHTQGGRPVAALTRLDACRPDLQRYGLVWEEGASWLLAAWAHIAVGDTAAGEAACGRALHLLHPLGDHWALAHAEGLLGELARAEHRYTDATAHLAGAAHAAGTLGFEAARAHHLLNLGRAQHQAGDPATSRSTLEQAVDLGLRCGDTRTVALARTRLAQLLRNAGETGTAMELATSAVDWFGTSGGGDGSRLADYVLAALHADAGVPTAGRELVGVLRRARQDADPDVEVLTLDALAALDLRAGRLDDARSALDAADVVAAEAPYLWPGDRVESERARRALAAPVPL
ncbi:MAG TPA: BTAD domain-containing putative transcriptional regulator, partial [Mycobacteriales bacterium]|nr:BTAD domain-containing putative transcriptional regulator [Mycobacteriales bacterium]